ncbi:hypothetical protein Mal4_08030 [Maioricimonas rarisocia]|uniref:Lipopolysaccharide assembly protein A domain-containing protein n=1 Tax=Maioricimonas rarisocia TaxID=2528026 RepID=A0A517Z224_9PLAN|nr:LapA family protein [Maioricimonas rarisocia]QDU36517.1 hypothetical protein Mal4_08030 [Maioricimonas rarisocia]
MIQKLKIAGIVLLAVCALIVVLQNTGPVETDILFFTLTLPHAALLFGSVMVGFIIGVFVAGRMLSRRKA